MGQISSHEDQAAELTDRIAVMEEELRRVRDVVLSPHPFGTSEEVSLNLWK